MTDGEARKDNRLMSDDPPSALTDESKKVRLHGCRQAGPAGVLEAQAAADPSMLSRPLDQVEVWLDGAWVVGSPTTEAGPHQADKSPVATAAAAPPLENYILAAAASSTLHSAHSQHPCSPL